jgi:hypothetical protein
MPMGTATCRWAMGDGHVAVGGLDGFDGVRVLSPRHLREYP